MRSLLFFVYSLLLLFTPASAALGNGVDLRILPVGDSITYGFKSSDGNGYRNDLLSKFSGNNVRYIGSQRAGNMANNQNDGYSGFEISQIASQIAPALSQRPNIVLLMAGTNDINNNDNTGTAPNRLGALLDQIISTCPDAVVVLAKITPIADGAAESRARTFNSAIDTVAQSRINAGHKVVVVDMQNSRNGLTAGDLTDGLHPTNAGYAKMANVWWDGLNIASSKNLITAPVKGASLGGEAQCHGNLFWYNNHGTIASGVGSSDGPFKSLWQPVGTVATGIGPGPGVRIADMDGDGIDDYVMVDAKTGAAELYINGGYSNGKINWISEGQIASGIGDGAGVRFADITGDGKADYIWIGKDGSLTAYENGGPKSGGGWNFRPLNSITKGLDTGNRNSIIFADLDGDGRADFSIVGSGGSLKSWIATGRDPEPKWLPLGQTASGIGDLAGVHLVDLNGDGRADYVWLDKNSASYAYMNLRAKDSLVPSWINAGQIGSGVGTGRENITFGDLTGDGKADFLVIHNGTGAIDMYVNNGKGASYQAGDQVVFADLDGDGLDDYISIGPNGALLAYQNGGANSAAHNGWNWINWGTIASGVAKREQIRLADLNGDGKADYIYLDDKTGAVQAYMNGGKNTNAANGWLWIETGKIASGVAPGKQVHFADINGDGKADYLAVDGAGAVTAYLNGGANSQANLGWLWISAGRIASGVGPGTEIRFADIDGDGLADYLVLDKSTGAVHEYINGGPSPNAPGGWLWIDQGQIAAGVGSSGQSIVFGAVSSRRADYLVVTPSNGAVYLWANGCDGTVGSGGGGGGGSGGGGGGGGGTSGDPDGGDDYPDDYEPPFDPDHYLPCNAVFKNVDDLKNQQDSVPPYCMNKYLVDALVNMWGDAMDKYNSLLRDGYDDKFNSYAKYVSDSVQPQINAFMGNGHAGDFFDCSETITVACCSSCRFGDCSDCSSDPNCQDGKPTTRKITCPTVFKDGPNGINSGSKVPNTTYTLRDSDGFYKAINDADGVQKDWIKYDDILIVPSQGCQFAGTDVEKCERQNGLWFWNYPTKGTVDVANPKDVVSKSDGPVSDLKHSLQLMEFLADYDGFSQMSDLVDAGSVPAFSVLAAVEAMDKVAKAGGEIQDQERKEMIVSFVTSILFLVPFAGEAAGAAGLTAIRASLDLVGALGDAGLAVYGIVSDPKSALETIFLTLIGAGLNRDAWKKGADSRRSISSDDIGKLGSVKDRLNTISAARVRSCRI